MSVWFKFVGNSSKYIERISTLNMTSYYLGQETPKAIRKVEYRKKLPTILPAKF